MTNTGNRSVVPAIAVVALLLGACGSDDDGTAAAADETASTAAEVPESAATTEPAATTPPTTTEAPAAAPAFTDQDVVVAVDALITADWYPPEGRVGTSTYTLVVEDGELKVLEHRWTGDLLYMGVPTGVNH